MMLRRSALIELQNMHGHSRATVTLGFAAMLADEYKLIVPFAYHLQSRLDFYY